MIPVDSIARMFVSGHDRPGVIAMPLRPFQDMILTCDLPEEGLQAGDVGTVVERHEAAGREDRYHTSLGAGRKPIIDRLLHDGPPPAGHARHPGGGLTGPWRVARLDGGIALPVAVAEAGT